MQRVIHFVTVLLKDYIIVNINDSLLHKGPPQGSYFEKAQVLLQIMFVYWISDPDL